MSADTTLCSASLPTSPAAPCEASPAPALASAFLTRNMQGQATTLHFTAWAISPPSSQVLKGYYCQQAHLSRMELLRPLPRPRMKRPLPLLLPLPLESPPPPSALSLRSGSGMSDGATCLLAPALIHGTEAGTQADVQLYSGLSSGLP